MKTTDNRDVGFSQSSAPVRRPSHARRVLHSALCASVGKVVSVCYPFQVSHRVIRRIVVYVVDLGTLWRWPKKGLSDQTVDVSIETFSLTGPMSLTTGPEGHERIAEVTDGRVQQAGAIEPWPITVLGPPTPDPSEVRDLIEPDADNGSPFFGGCTMGEHREPPIPGVGREGVPNAALAVLYHLSQGGAVALLEPFRVTRPGERGGHIEFRLAAMVHG